MLRSILTAALQSPRRLALVLAVGLAVLILVGRVTSPGAPAVTATPVPAPAGSAVSTAPTTPAPSPAVSAVNTPAPTPITPPKVTPPKVTPPKVTPPKVTPKVAPAPVVPRSALPLATAFVRAWSDQHAGASWFARVRPFVTPGLAAGLKSTNPTNVPATRVTGPAVVETASPLIVGVPTDAGCISVRIVAWQQDYRVADVTR